jgi:acetylornithine deacetylase/succinyl-diaminopimelate desuccinylase-like protein
MKHLFTFFCLLIFSSFGWAQTPLEKIRRYHTTQAHTILEEYLQFLQIPNVAYDTANIGKNAEFIRQMMQKRGIQARFLTANTPGVPPVVYGEVLHPKAKQTLVFYAHYDGQPVNPARWAEGLQPFQPVLSNGSLEKGAKIIPTPQDLSKLDPEYRIYARSASDDKIGVMTILNAYEAIVKNNLLPTVNIKFFFEGEEEMGSTHLSEILEKHKDLLKADLWIISDGPVHQSGRKQIVFGVRGDVNMEIKVYGPQRPLHSGHYGNWAPNPANRLVRLLASMKDDKGEVLIEGFYDDVIPLTEFEKKALANTPNVDTQMQNELGIHTPEGGGKSLSELINRPSLNINGIQSANVGMMSANVIPTVATCVLDLRLVLGNDHQRQVQKVIKHIEKQGYKVINRDPTEAEMMQYPLLAKVSPKTGYNAQRTKMDLPIAQKVIAAVQTTVKEPLVLQPTLGGSLPLFLFEQILQVPTLTVPIANHDNNQHAENENVRLKNIWEGIETMVAIMLMK